MTDGHMVHGSRRWHADDSCFRCDYCACSLLGRPFVAVPGKDAIYCANCGVMQKATNSTSYMDKCDGIVDVDCLSPSSPMMKVRELSSKAFYSKYEGADGQIWHEESPVKASAKFVSPHNSPLPCMPVAAELQTRSALCCDDHRLSAEFQVCATSCEEHNNSILASQTSSENEKPLPQISPAKHSASDLKLAAQTTECGGMSDFSSPRPPVLIASGGDCLDDAAEMNARLEELIVEPSWHRDEPDGLVAEGTQVAGASDDIGQRSRKSKNLNVRFDPSTKDACSPVAHGVYCERWRPSSHRSLDDSDIPYMSCDSHCHTAGPDGSASVRIRRRRFGHGRHRDQNDDIRSKVEMSSNRSHRASMQGGNSWWVETADDHEHCSTCSSSSSDSDFDYGDAVFSSKAAPMQSQTLPQRRRNAAAAASVPLNQQVQRSRKHKKKHCVLS